MVIEFNKETDFPDRNFIVTIFNWTLEEESGGLLAEVNCGPDGGSRG